MHWQTFSQLINDHPHISPLFEDATPTGMIFAEKEDVRLVPMGAIQVLQEQLRCWPLPSLRCGDVVRCRQSGCFHKVSF